MDQGGCALILGVKDNKILEVKGDPDGYLNRGYICQKGLASPERLNHPMRLTQPLRRRGNRGAGKWDPITWPAALSIIRENLLGVKNRYGAKSVVFCQGMPKGLDYFTLIRLANTFGSPNVVGVQDVCHAPRDITGFHTCGFYPVADYQNPGKLVVLWGSNNTSTNEEGQICSQLLKRLKQGSDLIVVDPRKTALAGKARFWLQIKPGADNALALAFLNVIIQEGLYDKEFVKEWTYGFDDLNAHIKEFTPEKMAEVTWVPADLIRESARAYAVAKPAAIGWGNALEQNSNAFDTARALVCLMAVCGNLDVPGGNIQANEPDILGLGRFVRSDLIPNKKEEMIHSSHHTIRGLMMVPPAYLKRAILDEKPYPVKAVYMQGANPLLSYADSRNTRDALLKLDFLAVSEIFMTPTAAFADIVLPAATHFEFNDIGHYGLGHGVLLSRPKVVEAPKGCRPDIMIINALGNALTNGEYWFDDYQELLDMLIEPSGYSYREFVEKGYLKGADRYQKYLSNGFRTPTGKVELSLSRHEKLNVKALPGINSPEPDDPEFPFYLTCSKSRFFLHSSYRWINTLRDHYPWPVVMIHPDTAEKFDIQNGDDVIIETTLGSISQSARLFDGIHPKVIYAAYGWWFPEEKISNQFEWERSNYNILTSNKDIGKEFGTPNLKGLKCRIRRG